MAKFRVDLTGHRIGKLTVVRHVGSVNNRSAWLCLCTCGGTKVVSSAMLRMAEAGRTGTRSCGCLRSESRIVHGATAHGKLTPEYQTWAAMRSRCFDTGHHAHSRYGGRGITICERWLGENGYGNFVADMGRRPSRQHCIERIDNDGNYEPNNCRWATKAEQNRNKSDAHLITVNGVTRCQRDWSRETGVR